MAVSIPADLIWDILACLPVKDLLRLRCVSKFFNSIINSPDFSKLHILHSQKIQPDLYGVSGWVRFQYPRQKLFDVSNSVDSVSVVMVNRPSYFDFSNYVDNVSAYFERTDLWVVVGSCNGLIASYLNKDIGHIMFWNPFTGKSKKTALSKPHKFPTTYGFGYDPRTDDYKLVRIDVFHDDSEINRNHVTLKTAIYRLKTNSWKEVGNDFFVNSRNGFCSLDFGVLSSNALHWMIDDEINDRKIVAFDLVKEEFYYVPVYGCFRYTGWVKLSVLDECLALSFKYGMRNHVWVMKEYGVEKSWTEVFSYLRSELKYSDYIIPLAYSNKCDKVLLSSNSSWYWYDLNSKKLDSCLDRMSDICAPKVKIFSGNLLAPNDLVDLKKKQTFLEYNKETDEEKRIWM